MGYSTATVFVDPRIVTDQTFNMSGNKEKLNKHEQRKD